MEEVQCPQCLRFFDCCAANISICGCMDIVLSPIVKAYLAERYDRCLCMDCLTALKNRLENNSPQE